MKRFLYASFLSLLCCAGVRAQGVGFFRCSGRDILDTNGAPFAIKGNALSHWYNTEAYALRLNAVHYRHFGSESSIKTRILDILGEADAQTFWDTYHSNFVTQADVADLRAEGFNTIRLPFNYRLVSPAASNGVYSEAGFAVLDQMIGWCRSNGLAVILDMHACPGGQSYDAPADPEWTYWYWSSSISNWLETGVACLWVSNQEYNAQTGRTPEFNQQRMCDIWQTIASRYADEPVVLGYELMNEPVLPAGVTSNDLRALLVRVTDAIRAVDTNHILFVEGDLFASSMDGLTPPWDANTVLSFHKYWAPTTLAGIQAYLDLSTQYDVPLCMTEAGENSNPWFFEFRTLLESNHIGWCWWGYKKMDLISSAFSATISTDYQYVIDNFRDSPIDAARAKKGLMECATNLQTALCDYEPGWYAALLGAEFGTTPQPFTSVSLPGRIQAVNYDVGNNGVAYFDVRAKNEDGVTGAAYNSGYQYRNDGVDLWANTDSQSVGFHLGSTDSGEWVRYTVNVLTSDTYRAAFRVATSGGQIQLLDGTNALTEPMTITNTGGYGSWTTQTNNNPVSLVAGTHVLQLNVITGGVDVAWIEFAAGPPPAASTPTFSPDGGTFTNSVGVTLSSATAGSTIYYTTNGSTPTTNSPSVASGGSVTLSQPYTNSVRALATASGYLSSAISTSAVFAVVPTPPASAPTYSPTGGTFSNAVGVTLSSTTAGSTIYYTTNGTAPTTNSLSVAGGSAITLSQPYTNSVRAFAKASGYLNSAISTSAVFVVVPPIAATPSCSPNGGRYSNSVSVALSSATAGSTVYYTTNGTAPTTNSLSVASGGFITLSQPYSNSVRAFAKASGYVNSAISTSAVFAVVSPIAATPSCSPNGGTFTNSVGVTLSSVTAGSTIYYTTNGTAPTTNSPSVASGNSITLSRPYTNSVRAFAKASGYVNSAISTSAVFVVVPPPTASAPTYSPTGGTFSNAVNVTLSSTTAGSTIYYTTNGTAPTTNSLSVASGSAITLSRPFTNNVRAFAVAAGYQNSLISTSGLFKVVSASLQILNGALSGSGTQPTNWLYWSDSNHDPDTGTYRSSPNSWTFWYEGGLYQDITNGFAVGQTVTFGGYLRHPSWDALRNGTKYGIIQLEFRTAADVLISTASTAQINTNSAKDVWINVQATNTVPSGTGRIRIVVRCNDYTSGDGRFYADDLYVQ